MAPVLLGGALRIQTEVACPDPSEISAHVQRVLELTDESAATLQASVRRDGSWLVLSLAESDGSSLGERRVAYDGDCATLARAAAVVFAAWISNEHPEFLLALPMSGKKGKIKRCPRAPRKRHQRLPRARPRRRPQKNLARSCWQSRIGSAIEPFASSKD